jgi:eukaryotic-like serine/threonine-protein kinase
MIGETILHYKILDKLGEGGMGIVYLAEDTRLKRQVAIKFLPHNISANEEERKRLEIEAQAAASLNHPNIATIYAIEESNSQIFIVMEYIEGKELKDIVETRHAPSLQMNVVINYAIQIAEGLEAAHKKGIIHRDIKSSNIMITNDGKVKIMDFGLAKVRGGTQLTKVGSTVGTAAYMSPEQAKGEEVDHRTDIWSFGVVLYEMLTGKLPFKGEYDQAVVYSIINDEPELSEKITPELNYAINKAIAKERKNRYQSATEFLNDLTEINHGLTTKSFTNEKTFQTKINSSTEKKKKKWVVSVAIIGFVVFVTAAYLFFNNKSEEKTTSSERKMIVVLPFQNLGSPDDEYFADGITGEITSKLSGLSGLGVIARASAMRYKNSQKTLKQIGNDLGVQYVLEGTVQWELLPDGKKRIRVNPELIDINNSTQMWSKPYEADFSNAFTLQAEIASTVADALNLTLIKSEQISLEKKITSNSDAYDIYLKALYYSSDIGNEKNSRIAVEMLEKAISLDKNFAEAYALLSTVQSNMYWEYFERTEEFLNNSKINAQTALKIDPDLADAHVAMGNYYYHGILDYNSALQEYNNAIKINPNDVEANNGIAFVLRREGKMHETISYLEKTFKLDPKNYNTIYSIGETNCLLREYDKVVPYLDDAISITPDAVFAYDMKVRSYLLSSGNIEAARKVIMNALNKKIGLDSKDFINTIYLFDVMDRNFEGALNRVKGVNKIDIQFTYKPEDLLSALVYRFMNNKILAFKNFKSAVQNLQKELKKHPQDSRMHSALGLSYAGLGEKENAIREGKRGLELMPVSKEAWRGTYRLLDLAQIYTIVGKQDLALDAIEDLLNKPTDALSVWFLKLDPIWEPLRGNPRYQELIKDIN